MQAGRGVGGNFIKTPFLKIDKSYEKCTLGKHAKQDI